jgi:hypothetical protein
VALVERNHKIQAFPSHRSDQSLAVCIRLPVTIRFANEVGDVLIAAPIESEPRLPFKFYI